MRHIRRAICISIIAALLAANPASANDWPVFRQNNDRTGSTNEHLDVRKLEQAWVYRSPIAPQPAWDGPARWDTYRRITLPPRRNYDVAFAPIIARQSLYFGSSADDSLHCIDTKTGKEKWTFTTGGPIRVAPTYYRDRIYFGSDDGYAYCISSDKGKLIWKHSPAPQERRALIDGRFISTRACRTGVTVFEDDNPRRATAYFAMSFMSWVNPYICAVDAETGKPKGKGRYVRRLDHPFPIEGAMLATKTHLYVPRGNKPPELFRRSDGTSLGGIWASSAGTFALHIAKENRIITCGFAYRGATALLDVPLDGLGDSKRIRYIRAAHSMAYLNNVSYTRNPGNVYATNRESNRKLWDVGGGAMYDVIVGGNMVFVGGDDKVRALNTSNGLTAWEGCVEGRAHALAVADRALFVSTDLGTITCFRPAKDDPKPKKVAEKKNETKNLPAARITAGPFVRYLDANSAEISWHTEHPTPTILVYGGGKRTFRDDKPKIVHRAVMTEILLDRPYAYRIRTLIDGEERQTGNYPVDTHFNFHIPSMPKLVAPYAKGRTAFLSATTAAYVVKAAKADQGLCLIIGADDGGQLGYGIARATRMRVLYVDGDPNQVRIVRKRLMATGAYGARVAVMHIRNHDNMPFPGGVFNLIIHGPLTIGKDIERIAEIGRLLKPVHGVAFIAQPAGSEKTASRGRGPVFKWDVTGTADGTWAKMRRTARTPGSKPWTHMYGGPDNSACSDDTLQGAASFEQFTTQWLGRPGARYQADRENRKPPPLAAKGRLFMQGLGTLIAVDAYDGTVLWSLEIPGLAHFNMPRDSSNFCTDGDYVYLAFRGKCWMIDAATGEMHKTLDVVPAPRRQQAPRWGYVASVDETLIGSTSQMGAEYVHYWGSGAWYEHGGWEKICSDQLFGIDKQTGSIKWTYAKGVVINTTITIGNKRIYFCESRDKRAIRSGSRVLNGGEIWDEQFLVALDVNTGKKLWEEKLERGRVVAGNAMYSLAYANEKLVLSSASGGKGGGNHFIYAFNAASGKEVWKAQMRWPGYGHGVHLGRPVIVQDTLYIAPGAFDLKTGKRLPIKAPKGACGTESASRHALFFRYSTIGIWDRKTQKSTAVPTVRPDCWLTAVPAEGLLLAPEGGGGCVCSFWLETSIALAPRTDTTEFKTKKTKFLGSMTVELITPVAPGVVRYTINQGDPTETSPEYTGPITIKNTSNIRARVVGAAVGPKRGPMVVKRFERLNPKRLEEARINFQHSATPRPEGWMVDIGNAVSIQDAGTAYGWNKVQHGWPNDPKQVKDPVKNTCNWLNQNVRWEMAVENGEYEVTISVGHPQGETKREHAGTIFVNETEFKLAKDLAKSELVTLTLKVKVTDDKLTMYKKDKKSIGVEYIQFRRL